MSDLVERLERIIRAGGAIDPETAELARDEIKRLRDKATEWEERARSQLETNRVWKKDNERLKTLRREETELYVDMVKRCDEARSAAREFAEYRPVPQEVRDNWIERFPWLGGSDE